MDCARKEGFIDDVGESFGHLDYILYLSKDNKIDGTVCQILAGKSLDRQLLEDF